MGEKPLVGKKRMKRKYRDNEIEPRSTPIDNIPEEEEKEIPMHLLDDWSDDGSDDVDFLEDEESSDEEDWTDESEQSISDDGDDVEETSEDEDGDLEEDDECIVFGGKKAESSNERSIAAAEESDSSEDEVPNRNTIGDVPLEWYEGEEHIGYDKTGKKIKKQAKKDKLDSFLAGADNSGNWRKIYDDYNDEEIELTKEETKLIRKIIKGKTPHSDANPYEEYIDWFNYEDKNHPVSSAPEPKSRFLPSRWEHKKVVKLVRAIRNGWIKADKPKEEPRCFLLWGDDTTENERRGLSYIPAPKAKLPGHELSYKPPVEYIPTQEEINSYQLMHEEDRPKFIPRRLESMRTAPAYDNALKESFERLLDLYLCPRIRKKRIDIDPESLKPKLPHPKDLQPYPTMCFLEYKGHTGPVTSISIHVSGEWIASGSNDGTARIWEVENGRCLKIWQFDEAIQHVAWNPLPELPIIAVSTGQDVFLLDTGCGSEDQSQNIKGLLNVNVSVLTTNSEENSAPLVTWVNHEKYDGIRLKHFKLVTTIDWHYKGDYFCTVVPTILIHQLSKKQTQNSIKKLHGLPVTAVFHPSRPFFFVSTKKNVRVYNLSNQKLIKKLETGFREISSISIHPGGDNVIVGSKEGKLCWFDMDLSCKPYKTMRNNLKDITGVAFHRSYPLFAICSHDSIAYVFHGMVYSDLNQNPLIVPLKILRGHKKTNGGGVLDCKFHPKEPWLFTAGGDSVIKLYCNEAPSMY
ncbi:putative Ribosome biogenesis protein bop1 [Zostera marina]|uniref:Ribosome biogenesis protein BOP1 homolog n=1 Tax=Zostera marina TaxID=29655 RepID=A0A0K9PHV2_ZOSMR|nr:putative Ribosome biogenesis protein bop1 [Zostera marina]